MNDLRRPRVQPVAVLFLCALGLSACASDEKKINWEQDKAQVNASIQQVQDIQQKAASVDRQQLDALAEMQIKIEELERQNQARLAQVEALSSRIEKLHSKKTAVAKPKKRVHVMKKPTARLPIAVVAPAKPAIAKVDQAALDLAEKNAYTSAYLALKSGRFDEASNAFNKQLDLYPDGEYSDQAWYWLGETRFAQNDNARALNAFKYVADHYPNSVKHAAALLKLGQISEMQSKWQQSAAYYKRLIRDHADSSLAEQARAALSKIQGNPGITSGAQQ